MLWFDLFKHDALVADTICRHSCVKYINLITQKRQLVNYFMTRHSTTKNWLSKSTVLLLSFGWGRFKMAGCTYSMGVAPWKTNQRSSKTLQTTSFFYFIAKSTRQVLLTFLKVEKTKHENFYLVHLLSFFFLFYFSCLARTTKKLP